jgi:hypothetical protein
MNAFDALAAINLVIALFALARLRPATFFFSANQLVTLRALSDARSHGALESQSLFPAGLLTSEHLDIALALFVLSTAILTFFGSLPASKAPGIAPQRLPALPAWLQLAMAVYFAVVFFSTDTVFANAYGSDQGFNYQFNMGGLHALIVSLALYEVYRRVQLGSINRFVAFILVFVFFVLMDYIKGQTGLAAGNLLFAAIMLLGAGSHAKGLPQWVAMAVAIAAVVSLSAAIRVLRTSIADDGSAALHSLAPEHDSGSKGFLERSTNGEQYAAHVLECISLYESDHSREWRSVYNPILFTFEPAFLLEPLGITRPKDAPWELGEYFVHGGGIFVVGELYWNGGYLCVAIVLTIILGAAYLCDTRYRTSFVWLMLLCEFAPTLLMGVGYGFAQVSRGFINGLIVLAVYYVFRHALPMFVVKAPELRPREPRPAAAASGLTPLR